MQASDLVSVAVERIAISFAGFFSARHVAGVAKDFATLQTSMAEVSTLLSDTSGLDALTGAVERMSAAFGKAAPDQAKALYQVISAGARDSAEALETLDAANRLAIGGVTSVEIAADGLTSVLNAYGAAVGSAADVSDALFVAMRAGKTTVGELSGAIGKVAPLAAQAGVSLEEVLSATAALTKGGQDTSEAMRGLRQIIASVVKPSSEAEAMAAKLGVQFNAAALEAQGLSGFLQNLTTATGGSTEQMAQLFGGVEALVPVLALTGEGAGAFADTLDQMGDRAGATEEAFSRMADTLDFRIDQIQQRFAAWERGIVEGAVPAVEVLIDGVDELTKVGITLAALYASRVTKSLVAATVAKVQASIATKAMAVAELEAATAAQAAARAHFAMAQSMKVSRIAAVEQVAAGQALVAANAQVATAQAAVTASTITLTGALRGALALIGGPLGAAILAAGAGWLIYSHNQAEAREEAAAHTAELEKLRGKLSAVSAEEARNAAATAQAAVVRKDAAIEELRAQEQALEAQRRGSKPSDRIALNREIENTRIALAAETEARDRLNVLAESARDRIFEIASAESAAAIEAKRVADETKRTAEDAARAADEAERFAKAMGLDLDPGRASRIRSANREREVTGQNSATDEFFKLGLDLPDLTPLQEDIQALGLSADESAALVDTLAAAFDKDATALVGGMAAMADAFGLLSDGSRSALRGVSDLVQGIKGIGDAKGKGVLAMVGPIGSAIGGITSIIGGFMASSEAQAQRIHDARENFENTLDEYVAALSDTSRWDELRSDATGGAEEALRDLFATVVAGIKNDKFREQITDQFNEALEGLDTEGLKKVLAEFGPEGQAILDAYLKHLQKIEEQRQSEVDSMTQSVQVRMLSAQGLDEEAEALQRKIARETEMAKARELEDTALLALLEELYEMEDAALAAAEAVRAANEAQRKAAEGADFLTQLDIMEAENAGDYEGASILGLTAQAQKDIDEARKLFEDGIIDQDTLDRFIQAVGVGLTKAIHNVTEASQQAAQAAQFQAQMEMENLQLRLLVANGMDEEAFKLRQTLEYLAAVNDEKGDEYLATLKQVHAAELQAWNAQRQHAEAIQNQTQATNEAKEAAEGLARAFNAPTGLILSLYKAQVLREQGGPNDPFGVNRASPGFGGGSSTSIRIEPGAIQINAAPGMDANAVGDAVVKRITGEAQFQVLAGGQNPFDLVDTV